MRLKILDQVMPGEPVGDISRTLRYRPEFFGGAVSQSVHALLRGPSDWQIGERELFAAFVSKLNACRF